MAAIYESPLTIHFGSPFSSGYARATGPKSFSVTALHGPLGLRGADALRVGALW
ncbi:hypothetical protein ACIHIX_41315 [Streptomyces sp. NPDC051913]|uniref:hypothetical protein n=1 Tax=Streptomyces sp. NPDC051913 TaxID=3365676 RepID=UPI0037D22342